MSSKSRIGTQLSEHSSSRRQIEPAFAVPTPSLALYNSPKSDFPGENDLDCRIIRAAVGFERDVRISAFEGKVSPGIVQEVRREIRIFAGTTDLKWEVYLDRRHIPEKTDSHPPEPNADPLEYHRTFKRTSQEASWLSVDCQVFPGEWPNPSQCRLTGSFEEIYRLSEYLVGCHSRDESSQIIHHANIK